MASKNELENEELAKRQYLESLEDIRAHIEKKNIFKNLTRCLSEDQRAQKKNDSINKAKEALHIQQHQYEKDEQLSRELVKIKNDEIVEKRLRQHLRENCHELKALETKLKAAYINKEIVAQVAEKEARELQEKIKEKEANKLLASARITDAEYRQSQVQEDIDRKEKYKQELHDQMIYNEANKRFTYDEFLREKKTLDDISEQIFNEDERARQEKWCKMKKAQQEIQAFKDAQEFWKQKHKKEIADENKKIQEYLFSKASDAKAKLEEKERKEALKSKIFNDIAMQMYEIKRKRDEHEEILLKLLEEERKEEIEQRHTEEVQKQIRQRQEMLASLDKQMEEQAERNRKQAEEDARYKEQLIIKIAEDERVEQLSNEKKRLKMIAVRRAVEEMMVQRRQKKAEEMQLQMQLIEQEQQEAENKERIIQEERISLLKEHGENLIGYLPKGLIRPDDVQYLGQDVVNRWFQKE